MKRKPKTNGQVIEKLVKDYFEMYLSFLNNPIPNSTMSARDYATLDLRMRIWRDQLALEKLENKIAAHETGKE